MGTAKVVCLILALVAAIGYFLMGAGVTHAADLTLTDAPPGFTWVAGAFYVICGLLVFINIRWLTITLLVINFIPIVAFYVMWAGRGDVLSSMPGLMTKIPQILLEAGLAYLFLKAGKSVNTITVK